MSADYGYINARVRGMKSRLLGPEFYAGALEATDFRAFLSALAQSPYVRELEEAQSRYQGLKALDDALSRNFYQAARSILSFSDGKPHRLISLLLLRYDLNNIKAIARAQHAGRSLEETQEVFFPAGELKPAVLENAAAAPDMTAAAQALSATPLKSAFIKAAQAYQADGDLYQLELALDRAYFRILFEVLEQLGAPADFVAYLRLEVDATNLRTALKLQGSERSAELFIPGGKQIGRSLFDAILSGASGALQGLSGTRFAAVAETDSLAAAEKVIRGVLTQAARRLASDPLDIGVVAYYLRLKEAETARLRLIGRAKYYGVPRATLERELADA